MKTEIRWPDAHLPADAAAFVSNELVIAATPAQIWPWLIRAGCWPEWYGRAADIHFLSTAGPDLQARTRFRWESCGRRLSSRVLEFEPQSRIAWDAHGVGVDAYHAWLLTPLEDGKTRVLTEETQNGWRARLSHMLHPRRLAAAHRQWLQALNAQATSGKPLGAPATSPFRVQGQSAAGQIG